MLINQFALNLDHSQAQDVATILDNMVSYIKQSGCNTNSEFSLALEKQLADYVESIA